MASSPFTLQLTMKHWNSISFFLLFFLLSLAIGCQKSNRPDGMPPLHPLKIKITQDGGALAGATVSLISTSPEGGKWPSSGLTDANGEAEIITYGQFPGAPEGNYKVVVTKTETVNDMTVDPPKVLGVFSYIEKKYTQSSSTELTLDVKADTKTATFDVGKAVKDKQAAPPS